MLGVIYLFVCLFFGVQLLHIMFPDPQRLYIGIAPQKETLTKIPTSLFFFPAGFIVGLILVTTLTYWMALLMTPFVPHEMPVLYPANIVSLCFSLYLGSVFWQKNYFRRNPPPPEPPKDLEPPRRRLGGKAQEEPVMAPKPKLSAPGFSKTKGVVIFYVLSILFFAAAGAAIFYYTFYAAGNTVYAGYSVFSDLAPHTALISSFANGTNFPTQYPHFPGGGIRYHFLFYFLCGNLNKLGMRIDHALNIPSLLVLVCCFILLGVLAVLLSGRRAAFFLAPVLVLFRSSYAIVPQIIALIQMPGATLSSVVSGILTNTEFIGTTPYDNWGLWAVNVYANQRHLLLGVALLLILVYLFLPHVRRMFLHIRKARGFKAKIKHFLFCREAWIPRKKDPIRPYALGVLALMIVICMPYFHGSALIAALLVLFLMAIFSENRLMYAVVAAAAVGSSLIQTQYFSGGAGNVVSFAYYWGFVVENPTLLNIVIYVGELLGMASVLLLILLFTQKSFYRTVLILAFALPAVLAFFFTVSIDVTANHKFIQISLILLSIFLASLLAFLWRPFSDRKKSQNLPDDASQQDEIPKVHPIGRKFAVAGTRILAVILFITLTASGISDWIVCYNKDKNSLQMNLASPVVSWIEGNTDDGAVFVTAPFAMNTFFLSGRFAYYGHPYYAWSAGYDTEARMAIYAQLLTGCSGDAEKFLTLCRQENISYILMDNELRSIQDFTVDEDFFNENLTIAASFPTESSTVIYRVY